MNLTEQLRGNFPKTIDKSKPVFSSLIANDNEDAAIQKQLKDLFAYMKEWTSTPDVYEQSGVMLNKTINFFSFLERFADETDKSFKNRFRAIFVRNHDKKWGTPYDVKNVFRQYFPSATIYLVENVNKIDSTETGLANMFLDGDISTDTPTDWTLVNCAASSEARFSKAYGITLAQSGASLSQNVNITASTTYFVHFFLKGNCDVVVKDNNNKYWDFTSKTWKDSEVRNSFTTAVKDRDGNITSYEWDNRSLFFTATSTASSVTVYFKYKDIETFVDYFRMFLKQPYGSFSVIAHFEGNSAVGAFGLAPGDADPNIETTENTPPQPRYSRYGYYDKSFLSGVPIGFASDIYEDLLDYLRAQGVRAFLEIVIKDYSGESE